MTYLVSVAVVVLVDQYSKHVALARRHGAGPFPRRLFSIRPSLHARELYRSNGGRAMLLLLWLATLIWVALLHATGMYFRSEASHIGLGLAFGGAAGNLLDITRRSGIVDFLDFGGLASCNVADAAIVAGLSIAFAFCF